jgi:HrpA-like RNA helicase
MLTLRLVICSLTFTPLRSVPEILRVNLAQVILQLKRMGISDPSSFEFLTPPNAQSLKRATKLLYALNALDDQLDLTEYGKKLANLPLDPVYGHLLLQSAQYSCVSEILTIVSMLSVDNLFYLPTSAKNIVGAGGANDGSGGGSRVKAAMAHKRFVSHEGDLPTFLNVYQAWRDEAIFVPGAAGGRKAQKKLLKLQEQQYSQGQQQQHRHSNNNKLLHGDWCTRNYVSGRSLSRAHDVRKQLEMLCSRPVNQHGLGMDVTLSCRNSSVKPPKDGSGGVGGGGIEMMYKCIASGLFLQVASRIKTTTGMTDNNNNNNRHRHRHGGRSGDVLSQQQLRGRYRTKLGNQVVSIHPTSSMFGRQPAPSCVVYTELITTTKTYIRGVTQIREEWLQEVAPAFYPTPGK